MKNNNKTLLITGASSGIGHYIVETLAARGWFIFAGYRDEKAAAEIKKISPENIQPLYLDVTDENSVLAARELINKSGRQLNVLFNNAGTSLGGPLEVISITEMKKLFEVNYFGYVRLIQNFLPLLRASQGRIVNISSISGLFTNAFLIPYCATKYAVESLSDGLRRELKNQKIKVVMIEPGSVKTPIWKKSTAWSEDLLKKARSEVLNSYQPALNNFLKLLVLNEKQAVRPEKLKRAIIKSVESKRPQARYRGYFSNWFMAQLLRFLPPKAIDWFFTRLLNK
ncbi:MAG: SDR family oxidoreductase [Patescibacteria group bacterium]|jgi:NAD(P)-dependent dehydrogenase (short-subunit alcohol dehydrogenase family)